MQTLTGLQEMLDVLPAEVTAGDFACGLLGFENALDSEPVHIPAGAWTEHCMSRQVAVVSVCR